MSKVALGGGGKAKAQVIGASRIVDKMVCPLSPRAHLRARREQLQPSSVSERRKVSCEDLGFRIFTEGTCEPWKGETLDFESLWAFLVPGEPLFHLR